MLSISYSHVGASQNGPLLDGCFRGFGPNPFETPGPPFCSPRPRPAHGPNRPPRVARDPRGVRGGGGGRGGAGGGGGGGAGAGRGATHGGADGWKWFSPTCDLKNSQVESERFEDGLEVFKSRCMGLSQDRNPLVLLFFVCFDQPNGAPPVLRVAMGQAKRKEPPKLDTAELPRG